MKGFVAAGLLALQASMGFAKPVVAPTEVSELHKRQSGYQNIAYFVNWGIYDRDYQPDALPSGQLNQVLYAFANIQTDGTVVTGDSYADLEKHYSNDSWDEPGNNAYGCVKQLYLLKQANRNMKVLLSIGGWTWSTNFPAAAASETSRSTFATSAVTLMKDWGFDGIDIDWEYPADDTEASNMILLIDAIRDEMDSYSTQYADGYHFLLTAAMPAGPTNYNKLKLSQLGEKLDQLNLMAYDYAGSFSNATGHQANLYPSESDPAGTPFSTDKAITDYIAAGVPAEKIILGLPLYGRAFVGTEGLGQSFTGVGSGSWEDGIWDYKVLPKSGATEMTDDEAGATYSWDESASTLISYDTVDMVNTKLEYLKKMALGGTMFWEASGDRTDDGSLIATTFNGLGSIASSDNLLDYPNSQYDNIASGMA